MSTPSDETGKSTEPTERVDPTDNAEVRAVQEGGSRQVARGSDGGTQPSPARSPEDPLGTQEDVPAGTGAGNPLDGVLISEEDAEHAVSGDTGPESSSGR
ncbi:hypothetical protein [Kineococcus indalonis]|uniref:hypothetical protein n=1 Tax=Kineococcus indalonis TaxID=2696566 RepID=UPI0014124FA2|nr:hypothetical protein [Kineococcus indalonis]NAZ86148.1 hypothetical protein [Kineococcus indalonis]